jgi:hypothetical protein
MPWKGWRDAEVAGERLRANRLRINAARSGRPIRGPPTVLGDLLVRMLPLERADSAKAPQ